MIWLVVYIWLIEWAIKTDYCKTHFPVIYEHQWEIFLGAEHLIQSILLIALLNAYLKKSLLLRSVVALLAISAFFDVLNFSIWQITDNKVDFSAPVAIIFLIWLIFTMKRQYPEKLDDINQENINILILKPRSAFEVIKGLIGAPAASICLVSNDYIWMFRKSSGIFERLVYNDHWLAQHLAIDTGVKYSVDYYDDICNLIGTKRAPGIKCIWVIRNVLNKIGGKYAIKTWFDYIPGFYFMRII